MKNKISFLYLLASLLTLWLSYFDAKVSVAGAQSAARPPEEAHVRAVLVANTKSIIAGKPFRLGVQLIMNPGWHTYYREPGDAGMATKIIWQLPPGFKSESLLWEKPNKFSDAGINTYGYEDKTLIVAKINPPGKLPIGKRLNFSAQVEWLSCKDLCVPGHAKIQLSLNVADAKTSNLSNLSNNETLFAKANFDGPVSQLDNVMNKFDVLKNKTSNSATSASGSDFLIYFVFAFLGGILLNFMPCVLPVVAIKVLSLLEQTSKDSARASTVAFASGIFSSFLFLGLIVAGLQSAGHQVGWGFQFQQPVFLMFMSTLVLLFALSLFGLLDVSFSFGQNTVNKLAGQKGLSGDFFKGVLATILSTPCTAPFLGTALGFAFILALVNYPCHICCRRGGHVRALYYSNCCSRLYKVSTQAWCMDGKAERSIRFYFVCHHNLVG